MFLQIVLFDRITYSFILDINIIIMYTNLGSIYMPFLKNKNET